MTDDTYETPSSTPNFQTELAEQLAELVPEAVADGKIDVLKLQQLLDQDAAETSERYGLFWPGKQQALRAAQTPTTATLRPDFENSRNWIETQNVFIAGDNLEVLKILQKHYHAKIKVIYADPPYNTGRDFVYKDNFKDSTSAYLEWTRQVTDNGKKVSSNAETDGRYHSNWLSMMYPRLKLARNLMTEDGIIAISIDDIEHAGLVQVVREIFGEDNFLASVSRVSKKTSNKGAHFAPSKDHLVVAARNVNMLPPLMAEVSEDYKKKFSEKDARGNFATVGLYQASLDPMRGCSNQRYWIQTPDGGFVIPPGPNLPQTVEDGFNRAPESREDKVWRWSFDSYLKQKDLLVFKKTGTSPLQNPDGSQAEWNVYTKYYLEDRLEDGIRPRDFIDDATNDLGTKTLISLGLGPYFDFAKPTQLINKILTWVADPDAIVLDFFAGSSTTAHAVLLANEEDGGRRRFIQVQLPEPTPSDSEARRQGYETISDLSAARIRLAAEAIESDQENKLATTATNSDRGFRAYRLSESNFSKWQVPSSIGESDLEGLILDVKENADDKSSSEDLLTEILLKRGFSLSEKIEQIEIGELKVHSIGEGLVIALLDEHSKPTVDQLQLVVREQPAKLILLEDVFKGDDELKTNLSQLCKSKDIELWTA